MWLIIVAFVLEILVGSKINPSCFEKELTLLSDLNLSRRQ